MIRQMRYLIAAILVGLPLSVQADANGDKAYCEKLRETYTRYIGHDFGTARKNTGRASGQVAAAQCQSDPASSIKELERAIIGGGFVLPKRD
jgi:hypothetical protein